LMLSGKSILRKGALFFQIFNKVSIHSLGHGR
jgi:hypothetical protein